MSDHGGVASGEGHSEQEGPTQPPSDRLADRLEAGRSTPDPTLVRALRELAAVDKAVYRAVAATPTPTIDGPLRTFTSAADHSKLWIGAATVLFAFGGRRGRRAALTGVAAIACTSAIVNLPMKLAGQRRRPDADAAGVPLARRVEMPTSASFPSGHSASAAAFASSASSVVPALGLPLGAAAAAVGYSRVHSGVHYPGDVVAGAVVGTSVGGIVAWIGRRLAARRSR
ncbi:MAG TPA: phosphatase PAP2 family protein [Actinomycetota bacterium]|jgi:undecaprenyl-diphosphatase